MKLSRATTRTSLKFLCFVLLERIISSQDICPLDVLIWTSSDACEGAPNSRTPIFPDGACQFTNVTDGPGFYRATCDASNQIVTFEESGCSGGCFQSDVLLSTCDTTTTDEASSITVKLPVQDAFALNSSTAYNPPLLDNITIPSAQLESFTCHQLSVQDTVQISYALFGDCSDTSCISPSSSPTTLVSTVSPAPSPMTSNDDICPFEALVWTSSEACQGEPNSRTLLFPDNGCYESAAISGPGYYRATCDAATSQIAFAATGCAPGCPMEEDGDAACSPADDTIADLYFSVSPRHVYNPPLDASVTDPSNELSSFTCNQLALGGDVVVSYAFFGDCSDRSCTSPTDVPSFSPTGMIPTASPNPTGLTPTMSPTMMSTATTIQSPSTFCLMGGFVTLVATMAMMMASLR
mmetsp:Transcript_3947/g.5426  ORF Transcript_3947/g.5426 Transcript_3947/m.5426 type:complete len:409 (-) Transcript_3947:814-2040(-)